MTNQQPTNLYTLSEAIRAESERISEMMERTCGDEALMTPEDIEADRAFLDGLVTEMGLKADGYVVLFKILDEEEASRRRLAKHFSEMADRTAKQIETNKRYLIQRMRRAGMNRLDGATFTIAVQANGGKQPVEIIEGVELPDRFVSVEVVRKPNRDAIRDALLSGDSEAIQYATLLERGYSLRIN